MIDGNGITVVGTNPETANCINRLINQAHMHIIKSIKEQTANSTKKPLINDLSKRLLELEFKSNHSIKSKCLNELSKKYWQVIKNEKHTIGNKTNKTWKKPGTTCCLGCKDYTDNF